MPVIIVASECISIKAVDLAMLRQFIITDRGRSRRDREPKPQPLIP